MRPLLLVEDGIPSCDTLRWSLRRSGQAVNCVSGVDEALDYLHGADKPGLVVLHCRRPDPELLSHLKQTGAPVVVVSSAAGDAAEADAFLPAPVNDEELLQVVRSHRLTNSTGS